MGSTSENQIVWDRWGLGASSHLPWDPWGPWEHRGLWGACGSSCRERRGFPLQTVRSRCHLGNLCIVYVMQWETHRAFTFGSAPPCTATGQALPLSERAGRQQEHGDSNGLPFGTIPEFMGEHQRRVPGHGGCLVNHRDNDHNVTHIIISSCSWKATLPLIGVQ